MKIQNKIIKILNERYYTLNHYKGRRRSIAKEILKIKKEINAPISVDDGYRIYMAVKSVEKIEGDIAEVGVYMGASSKVICRAKGDKYLYLFDTFEGLPEVRKDIDSGYHKGKYLAPFDIVKNSFRNEHNVRIYKGLFPDTAKPIERKKFSFVNLDVDIYKSTLNCLKFFYPRMSRGGIIMSHDYTIIDEVDQGVTLAFNEFFKNKPEPIILTTGSQCLVVKV